MDNIVQGIIRILVIVSQIFDDNGETSLVFHFLDFSVQEVLELIRIVRLESDDNGHGFDILVEVLGLVRQLGHPIGDFSPVVGQDVFRGFDEVDDIERFFAVVGGFVDFGWDFGFFHGPGSGIGRRRSVGAGRAAVA